MQKKMMKYSEEMYLIFLMMGRNIKKVGSAKWKLSVATSEGLIILYI